MFEQYCSEEPFIWTLSLHSSTFLGQRSEYHLSMGSLNKITRNLWGAGIASSVRTARQSHYVSTLGKINRKFCSQKQPKIFCATYALLFIGHLGIAPGSKAALGLKLTTPLPQVQVEVKNNWSYTSIPSLAFVTCSRANLPSAWHRMWEIFPSYLLSF